MTLYSKPDRKDTELPMASEQFATRAEAHAGMSKWRKPQATTLPRACLATARRFCSAEEAAIRTEFQHSQKLIDLEQNAGEVQA